jgi:hypothetical protein
MILLPNATLNRRELEFPTQVMEKRNRLEEITCMRLSQSHLKYQLILAIHFKKSLSLVVKEKPQVPEEQETTASEEFAIRLEESLCQVRSLMCCP